MNHKKQKTILLVEDEVIIALSESKALKKYGYDIIHAQNGSQALESINDNKIVIDLVLMDINLGNEIDGTDIAKLILREKDIPILFLSNHIEREIVDKTENITSYGYVVKDSGITVLDASIKMAFRLHEAYLDLKDQKTEIENKEIELQLYEKRYRRLFESAQDGILILNADNGKIVDVNPYLIIMLNYSKEQFLQKNIWDISAFKNIDYSKQLYKELQDKEYVRYDDLPLETSDGKIIHVEFVSNVYLVDNEKVIQCNIRDITDRVNYEKTLTDDISKNKALLRELQHRSKNSFNMIISLISLRSNAIDSEETKMVLDELSLRIKSVADLYTLLHDTESYFAIPLKIYCRKIVESALSPSKKITINDLIEDITVPAKDAALIGMILVELLSNSIKYAFPGNKTGIINIKLERKREEIIFMVEDNGVGLPDNYNVPNSTNLGHVLVNLMVEQLGGTIKYTSENGAKIKINFPFKPSEN